MHDSLEMRALGQTGRGFRNTIASLVLTGPESQRELTRMAEAVPDLSRDDLLRTLGSAKDHFQNQPDVLNRLEQDRLDLQKLKGTTLADLAHELVGSQRSRHNRWSWVCRAGFVTTLGSCLLGISHPALAGPALCTAVAGIATAVTGAIKRYQVPERETLSRLAILAGLSGPTTQARELVEALANPGSASVKVQNGHLMVGGTILKRRS